MNEEANMTSIQETKEMTAAEIGETAGEIFRHLERHGDVTLQQLKKSIGRPGDTVAMALGWLAREDKIHFIQSGKVKKISLAG
jgi:hypothetical protein